MIERNAARGWLGLVSLLAMGCLLPAAPAAAQQEEPIPWFAVDARGSLPRFKQDVAVATPLGLVPEDLPGRGLGFDVGAHVYPLRAGWLTLGFGGSVHLSRASRGPQDVDGALVGRDVSVRFRALAPQVSVNFGHSRGWSYLSGGIATSRLRYTVDGTAADGETAPNRRTINYGGGARWFMKDHLAFSLDIRFYAIDPQEADLAAGRPASPRMTLLVVSAGVAFK